MTTNSTAKNVRLTISVSPEVHEAFFRMSKAANISISKCMGEWLLDTLEAAQFTALKMEEARSAPKLVAAQMHSYALGLVDETGSLINSIREKGRLARTETTKSARVAPTVPPSSNTGGKVPRNFPIPVKSSAKKRSVGG